MACDIFMNGFLPTISESCEIAMQTISKIVQESVVCEALINW